MKPVVLSGNTDDDAKKYQKNGCNGYRAIPKMTTKHHYVNNVEWSEEDQCFVWSCPGLFNGGCHGDDEKRFFAGLCELVDETIALYERDGKLLSPPTSGKD